MKNKVYYPVFLDLTGKRCVIVGGGQVAERKCRSLMKTRALITVIAPEITKKLRDYKDTGVMKQWPEMRSHYTSLLMLLIPRICVISLSHLFSEEARFQ